VTAHDDQQLLEQLNRALAPGPVEPPRETVTALRAAVAQQTAPRPVPARRPPRTWWRRPIPVLAAGAFLATGISTAAFASGATLPRPLRAAAHALHLPVDSPSLADTRTALAHLRALLPCGDPSRIQQAAGVLRDQLRALDPGARRTIADEAAQLLSHAEDTPGARCEKAAANSVGHDTPVPTESSNHRTGRGDPTTPDLQAGDNHDPTPPEPSGKPESPLANQDNGLTGSTTTTTGSDTTTAEPTITTTTTSGADTANAEPTTTSGADTANAEPPTTTTSGS
jgi:hypothetical protein